MNAIRHAAMNAHIARIRPDRFTLLLIAIAVLGAGLVLARQVNYGPSLHSDSVQHLSAARGLLAGDGLIDASTAGDPYQWWPPLFPVLLATGSFGILDPLDVAGPLNAICFGLTILVAGHWMRRHIRSRFLIVWGCLALALSIPVTWISSWVMSEAPFILFTALALTLTSAFLREPRRSTLLWAAVFTALAWLTRYIGVATVVTVTLLLLFQRDTPLAGKARRILGYGLVSSLPMVLFLTRNYITVGDLTTSRKMVDYSLPEILERTAVYLGGWVGLYRIGEDIDETIRIVLAISLLFLIGILGFRIHRSHPERLHPVYPFLLIIPVFYLLHVLAMFRGNTYDGLAIRHIIPLYIMFIFLITVLFDGVIQTRKVIFPRISQRIPNLGGIDSGYIILILVIFGWIGYGIHVNQEEIRIVNSSNYRTGYQAAMYADSDLIEFIDEIQGDTIYGNYHRETIYFHTNKLREYHLIPISNFGITYLIDNSSGAYIVYSHDPDIFVEYSIDDLHTIPNLDVIASFHDGTVFQIISSPESIWGAYDAIASGIPVVHSKFTIYIDARTLLYAADECDNSRISPRFFLHITPHSTKDLHSSRQQYGFDNIDFAFTDGPRYDPNRCMRSVLLPDYPIASIRTGQYDETGELWSVDIPFDVPSGG